MTHTCYAYVRIQLNALQIRGAIPCGKGPHCPHNKSVLMIDVVFLFSFLILYYKIVLLHTLLQQTRSSIYNLIYLYIHVFFGTIYMMYTFQYRCTIHMIEASLTIFFLKNSYYKNLKVQILINFFTVSSTSSSYIRLQIT